MDGYRECQVVGIYREGCFLQANQEVIDIGEIQPFETKLFRSHVDYFLDDPKRIFLQEHPMTLIFKNDMPFRCFPQNGNHRIYTLHRLGVKKLIIEHVAIDDEEWKDDFDVLFESAMEAYAAGIVAWDHAKVVEDRELLELFTKETNKIQHID